MLSATTVVKTVLYNTRSFHCLTKESNISKNFGTVSVHEASVSDATWGKIMHCFWFGLAVFSSKKLHHIFVQEKEIVENFRYLAYACYSPQYYDNYIL